MNSTRITSAAFALAAATALIAGAVAPAAAAANDPTAHAREAKTKPALPSATEDKRLYCVEGVVTGSRIAKSECHTRSEWIKLTGTDPATLRKN